MMAGEKFPAKQAERFCEDSGLSDNILEINMKVEKAKDVGLDKIFNTPDIIESRFITKIKRGYYIKLFSDNNLLEDFINIYWPRGKERTGRTYMNMCYGFMDTVEKYFEKRS